MAQFLRQTTSVIVHIGPFVAVGDGFTPQTGITLTAADEAEALKANTSATASISTLTWSAVTGADGWYALSLTTAETNTVGTLTVLVNDDSVCLPVFARFQVLEEAIYDSLFAASAAAFDANQDVTVGSFAAGAVTSAAFAASAINAAAIATSAITSAKFADGTITSAKFATSAITAGVVGTAVITSATIATSGIIAAHFNTDAIASAAVASTAVAKITAAVATSASIAALATSVAVGALPTSAAIADAVWDELQSQHVGAASFGEIATEIASILADTGTDGVIVGAVNAAGLADFFDTDSGTTYSAAAAGSVVKEIADNAGGASLTVSAIVDGMFTSNGPAYSAAAASSVVKAIAINAGNGALATSASIATLATSATAATLATSAAVGALPTSAAIADAVWDELQSQHVGAASFGEVATEIASILDDTGTAGVVLGTDAVTSAAVSSAAVAKVQAGLATSAATATSASIATLATSASIANVATSAQAGAIQTKTDSLTFTVANQVDANIESVNGTTVAGSGTSADPWGP